MLPHDERVFYNNDRSLLEVRNADVTDSGLYICEAKNELGAREVSAKVKVRTKQKLLITERSHTKLSGV